MSKPESLLRPDERALKHGIWAFHRARVLRCRQCQLHKLQGPCPEYRDEGECVFLERRGIELRDQLMALPQCSDEDNEIISEYIFLTQVLELIQAVLPSIGVLVERDGEVRLHPLLAEKYLGWSRRRQALGASLGIGPMARQKLGKAGKVVNPMFAKIIERHRADKERRRLLNEESVDAETEEEESGLAD